MWTNVVTTWAPHEVDLAAYAGQQVWVQFAFFSDAINQQQGVYIDDVTLAD